MKNKGRKHKATNLNKKGALTLLTRPITQTSRSEFLENANGVSKKFLKKKWHKRVRGYLKSQTKDILNQNYE